MTSEPPTLLGPDSVVGSYRLVKEIGRGGMGTVYEAQHVVLPRRAAVKVMHGELRRHPGMATRVVQEASILEDIRHPGIVRVFECNLLPDYRPWIAMELVEGETLANRLLQRRALEPAEVATLLAEVADVLAAVHARSIVHRDLKPDNLILAPHDRDFPLRVIDWGVARLGPIGRLTLDGLTPGTPIYMSPEQATGRNIGPACDIYSLGVIAYEALTGQPPFDGRTLAEVVSMHLTGDAAPLADRCGAPHDLCDLVHRMLEKHPAHRPGAIEVRQLARSLAAEVAAAYDSIEVEGAEPQPRALRPHHRVGVFAITDEAGVIDAESLEFGVTELVPTIRKPRWTPEIAFVPSELAAKRSARSSLKSITPKGLTDCVSGEIIAPKRR